MIWIPFLSISLFILTFILTSFIGWFRGWRLALFVSLIFLSLIGLFAFILNMFYKDTLWPLYSKYFLLNRINHSIGDYLELDVLAASYKGELVMATLGFLSPIAFIITFLIYKLFKKRVNKYMSPKVRDISKSEKTIVAKKNIIAIKASGLVISLASSLFIASLVGSSANVLFTPQENSRWFNKFNDSLANIYTFGLAGNSNDVDQINDFLVGLDQKAANHIMTLANISIYENENKIPTAQEMKNFSNGNDIVDLLANNANASEAVYSAILKKNSIKNDPLFFDDDTHNKSTDLNNNQIGYSGQYSGDLREKLQNFFNANPLASYHLTESIKKIYISLFNRSFIPYEDLFPVKNYNVAIKELQTLEAELKTRENNLSQLKTNFHSSIVSRDKSAELLFDLTSNSVLKGNPITTPYKIVPASPRQGSKLSNEINELANLKTIVLNKMNDFNKKFAYYQTKKNSYDNVNATYTSLTGQVDTAKQHVEQIKQNISSIDKQIKLKETNLSKIENQIQELTSKIQTLRNNKKSNLTSAETSKLDQQINTLEGELQTLTSSKTQLVNTINGLKANRTKETSLLDQANLDFDAKSQSANSYRDTQFLPAKTVMEQAKAEQEQYEKEWRRAEDNVKNQQRKIDDMQQQVDKSKANINEMNTQIVELDQKIQTLESKVVSKSDNGSIKWIEDQIVKKKEKIQQLQVIKDEKQQIYNTKKDELIKMYTQWINS